MIWVAAVIGNIGTWIRDVGAGWLMTTMSASATAVAMVQVATTLPIFLLSLPAGALADIVDRRRMLLWLNAAGALVMLAMAALTQAGWMSPTLLVLGLLLAGMTTALMAPVQQSLTPLMVSRPLLRPAIALNSLGVNVSRAIGPAIGGAIVAAVGVSLNFLVDASSYMVSILALWWWKQAATPASSGAPEQLGPAMIAGLRFAWHAPALRRVLLRAGSFFVFASAYWALLPIIARQELGGGPGFYGLMLTSVGAGAVVGALAMPALRRHVSAEGTMRLGLAATVGVLATLATVKQQHVAATVMSLAGAAWIAVLTTANVTAQNQLPNWVRGRGLALYLTVFYGAMTLGSFVWGQVADRASVPAALLAAAGVGVTSLLLGWRKPLPEAEPDLTPSMHWPEPAMTPAMADSLAQDRGPVLVTVEYCVAPERAAQFLATLRAFAHERLRDGAYQWGVFEDVAEHGRYVEHFLVPSWLEHERQHRRVSLADADLQDRVREFHLGPDAPRAQHYVAPAAEPMADGLEWR